MGDTLGLPLATVGTSVAGRPAVGLPLGDPIGAEVGVPVGAPVGLPMGASDGIIVFVGIGAWGTSGDTGGLEGSSNRTPAVG